MICGYLVTAELPPHKEESLRPYFREYLTIHEWRGLVKLNRLLLGSGSPLRSKIETLIRNGEVLFPEGLRSSAKISLEEIEPYHRLSFTESYLYVAASRIIFDMGGMKFPFYGRAYFFRHDDHMDMMLLVMPDETKEPVIYVTDDLAKTVAKGIYNKKINIKKVCHDTLKLSWQTFFNTVKLSFPYEGGRQYDILRKQARGQA